MPVSIFAIILASLLGALLLARGRYRLIFLAAALLLVVGTALFLIYLIQFGRHD